jgi:hypothetical protein
VAFITIIAESEFSAHTPEPDVGQRLCSRAPGPPQLQGRARVISPSPTENHTWTCY